MTGKEIFEMIEKKNIEYVNLIKDEEEQPSIVLSTHECFKLVVYLGHSSVYFNSIRCLASGELKSFDFGSVKISKK